MAERTAAEVLAMTRRALEEQEAARQLFEQEQTPEREFEYGAMVNVGDQQVPFDVISDRLYDQNLLAGLIGSAKDLFTGERREVLEPASVTYKDLPDRFDPATGRFTPMTEETITPGRFGPVEESFKFSPAYRGITSAAQFVEDMLKDPSKRQEALEMIKQFPEMFTKQMQASVQAGLMGERVVDPETGMSGLPSEALLAPIAALGAGRAVTTLPEGEVLGVFGGRRSKTGAEKIPEFEKKVFGGVPEKKAVAETGAFYGVDQQPRVNLGPVNVRQDVFESLDLKSPDKMVINFEDLIVKHGLNNRILVEYPEIKDLTVKLIPEYRKYYFGGENEQRTKNLTDYNLALSQRGEVPEVDAPFARSFYDESTKTLFIRSELEKTSASLDRQTEKIEKFNKQLASAVQNYIQKEEGFAPTESRQDILSAMADSPDLRQDAAPLITAREAGTLDVVAARKLKEKVQEFKKSIREQTAAFHEAKEKEFKANNPASEFNDEYILQNLNIARLSDRIADKFIDSPNMEFDLGEFTFTLRDALPSNFTYGGEDASGILERLKQYTKETPENLRRMAKEGRLPAFLSSRYRQLAEDFKAAVSIGVPEGEVEAPRERSLLRFGRRNPMNEKQQTVYNALITTADGFLEMPGGPALGDIIDQKIKGGAALQAFKQAENAQNLKEILIEDPNRPGFSKARRPVLPGIIESRMAQEAQADLDTTFLAEMIQRSSVTNQDVSDTVSLLPPAALVAYREGAEQQQFLSNQAAKKGLGRYDPNNVYFSEILKALDNVQRKSGTPEEFSRDLLSKVVNDPDVNFTKKDFDAMGVDNELEAAARYIARYTDKPGKLAKEDVRLALETKDRPLMVLDLSESDPRAASRHSYMTLFAGNEGRNSHNVFLITQPPRPGDDLVYAEPHFSGASGVTSIDDGSVKIPNILTHVRTTARQDGDDRILLIEELQPTVFQKGGQAPGVPIVKNRESIQKLALESMLLKAAERGDNTMAVLPGYGVKFVEGTGRDYGPQYDNKIPKDLKKLAKKYGAVYDDQIPIALREGDRVITKQYLEDLAQTESKVAELAPRAVELFDETTGQPGMYVMARGIRFSDDKGLEILQSKIGRAQGGAVQKYANGGMVNNMRKPVLSRGLSGLLSNYTSGPLARMTVPRGTPQGMFRGGAPGMRGVGFRGPQRIPEIDQSAITAALANLPASTPTGSRRTLDRDATEALAQGRPPPPTIPTNIAIQTPGPSPVAIQEEIVPVANAAARKGRGTIYDPRFDPVVNQTVVAQEGAVPMTAAETLAAAPIATRTAATPVAQALTGSRPTDFLGFETTEGAAEMGATAPGQTPFEPGVLITDPTGPTAEEIAAQQAAEAAAAQAAAEEAARLEAERLAAEEAARIAAEQEAERIRQEQLAAEQLAAQQAAEAAAAAEAQRQAELEAQRQAELEAQRQAEILARQEAERIAQEQAAQEAAAQQAAAQLAAEQLAAQEAAAQAEAQRLAEEEAARIAAEEAAQAEAQRIADEAAAEAERVRLAQIAEAEKLAEEQRLAELAAQEAARQEEERLAAEQLAAQEAAAQAAALAEQEAERIRQEEIAAALAQQEAAEAAERERVLAEIAERQRLEDEAAALAEQEALAAAQAEAAAAEQLAAEQLAAQQAADLAAQQNLEQQALAAEQLAAQQAAEQSALEAQIAATPDPDPVYTPPTQTEIDQAATVAQTEAGDLFTTPTDTGEVIDRGGFGTVDPVATTTTTTTTDAAQADPAQQQNTPAVITQASDGTFHPTPAAAAAYEQQLAAQQASGTSGLASLLTRPDFDVSQAIADYTSGYDSSRDKTFRRTFYPFQELTDEQKENAYIAEVFKPVADVSRFRPALTFGDTAGTTTGTTDTTGTDTSGIPTGNINTGAAASAPGQYGLASNQMYQCPEGYTLAFVNGRATCKSTKTAGGPGGRKDVPPEVITLGETA